jgi:SAM-dependent methyltransferase
LTTGGSGAGVGLDGGDPKQAVRDFWDDASCGEVYATGDEISSQFAAQASARYRLEPYLSPFARFEEGRGLDVLEIGVGMGADHLEWAKSSPRHLVGVDLTPRGVGWARRRLELSGFVPDVLVADAERLPFPDGSFELVYSWGVLHHTPDTRQAFQEVHRVLRPGGTARIMIYHTPSVVGGLLWARYGLFRGRPGRSMADIYATHLESPGTKAFSVAQAHELVRAFATAEIRVQLSFGDLLEGAVGQRHPSRLLSVLKRVWPRRLLQRLVPRWGLAMLIEARK